VSHLDATVARVRGFVSPAALVVALAALAGCDLTGQYEVKFAEAIQRAELRAAFDQRLFAAETDLTDAARQSVGVKLRLPTYFDKDSKPLPPADPRAQPPFVQLPHLSYSYERQLDDSGGKFLPVYLYVAAVPKAEMKADALQTALSGPIAAAFPGAAWADAQVPTPAGASVTLKRLRAEGPQDFVNLQTNAVVKQDGRFDLYLVDAGAHHLLLGWRAAKGQGDKYQFAAASEAAMGTIVISEAPPAADGQAAPKAPAGCAFAPPRSSRLRTDDRARLSVDDQKLPGVKFGHEYSTANHAAYNHAPTDHRDGAGVPQPRPRV